MITVPAGDDNTGGSSGEISPLTVPTTDDSTDPSSVGSTRRTKKSRKSAWQAGEARLEAKLEHDELRNRHTAAFKQATALMGAIL